MHTHSHKLWLGRLFALAPVALGASGCFTATVGDGKGCFDDAGNFDEEGSSCDEDDGGGYSDGGASGYSDGGSSDGGVQCSYGGKPVAQGQYLTTGYECEACYCAQGGKLYCQEYSCPADGGTPVCFANGESYAPGKFTPDGYDCTCSCSPNGKIDCEPGCGFDAGGDVWDPYSDGGWGPSYDAGWGPAYDAGWGPSYDSGVGSFDGGKPWLDGDRVWFDGGQLPYVDSGVPTDGGRPYYDGGKPDGGFWVCDLNGQSFVGTVLVNNGCDTCTCHTDGTTFCTHNECLPDGGAGTCDFFGVLPVGGHVNTGYQCDTCACVANGQLSCESKECSQGNGYPPVDGGIPDGTCEYEGNLYRLGDPIVSADKCQKCTCMLGGKVVCENAGCTTPTGCYLDETKFESGEQVVCPDGCNTCTCGGSKTDTTSWTNTWNSCPALPPIMACPAGVGSSAFPAQLVYRERDALAVVDSRCVNGQTLDYGLCWEGDLTKYVAQLYVFSTGTQRACNAAASERVFSLLPLRQALVAAFPNQPDLKLSLQGSDKTLTYTFRAP